jgi:hypothetical protein
VGAGALTLGPPSSPDRRVWKGYSNEIARVSEACGVVLVVAGTLPALPSG